VAEKTLHIPDTHKQGNYEIIHTNINTYFQEIAPHLKINPRCYTKILFQVFIHISIYDNIIPDQFKQYSNKYQKLMFKNYYILI